MGVIHAIFDAVRACLGVAVRGLTAGLGILVLVGLAVVGVWALACGTMGACGVGWFARRRRRRNQTVAEDGAPE